MNTLFILNDGPYGIERSYNALRLARTLGTIESQSVRVFLMGDAVACARSGQKVGVGYLTPDISVRIAVGTGSDRNGSGIVLAIVNKAHPNGPRSWILTGDCEYKFFIPTLAPANPIGIVVPHHGADLHGGSKVPAPIAGDQYKRLMYSFGPNNLHGKSNVQHPTGEGVSAHSSWDHGAWKTEKIRSTIPGDDILATAEHKNNPARGGVLVG